MKQTFSAVDRPLLPRRLPLDDPRVPEDVRVELARLADTIVAVGPVPAIDRIEWLGFDASGAMVASALVGTRTDGSH